MILLELSCEGFRRLSVPRFAPIPGINILRGANAAGKTSLLEAVLFLATSKSHRTTQDADLVSHSAQEFHVSCRVRRQDRDVSLTAHWWRGAKRFRVNEVAQTRISDILGKVNVVFFAPEDVGLVRDGAAQRRRFLDMELSQLSAAYLHALQQYRQVVRQRNELLRGQKPDQTLLDVWDEQLVLHGQALMDERKRFIEDLASPAAEAYGQIAQNEAFSVAYRPDIRAGESLRAVLAASRPADIRQAMTTRGPHRDDIEFLIAGESARNFASQGQQRTAALALKLAEIELFRERTGEYPILMLDDVLSELDAWRARRLVTAVQRGAQCLLTTTDLASKDALFGPGCAYFLVRDGQVIRQ